MTLYAMQMMRKELATGLLTFRLPMSHQYGTEGGKSLMQKSREDTDVLNVKGFRGTWKTTVETAVQEWMVRSMNDMAMKYEDWLRGCVHHDGRKGNVYLPCDRVLAIADWIEAHRDVAPVRHGRWKKEYGHYKCLLCNCLDDFADNYCPYCGARMNEGEYDDD